ncbi:hypothetical protein MBM_02970 [Drepanopeziza brunnea f. sp. 'multigermtubi' MB_m1]|uniref:Cell wall protein n=1 Tax=Marssonina brunnea f. sp. multigermtubi (strain MB_m1) TaxID=1072389 RepID=K1XD48_MARBU|nr:uncharacterized protein MBM_02970 [Drepanopeziza brunnea f. sp. 'multigermtubi' MB_m1]EKD18728.1 hypothetical protein MBM_02970 [Drepanopeziza brunnea f. sp. 'multigermtubi' MB_m1]
MQFQSILLSALFATSVVAKGDKVLSEKSMCKQMHKLEKFVAFASNTTELELITNNNATKVTQLQAEASAAAQKLSTMQSNATLVADCAVVNAQAEEEDQCRETFALQQFVKFAANTTEVAAKTNNDATKIANIQAEASVAATKLQSLESNSTLQAACPAVLQKDECKAMMKIQKFVNKVENATTLAKLSKGDATKEQELKEKAAMAQTKLKQLQSNATFMAACNAMGMKGTTGKGIDSGASSEESATNGPKSGASMAGASSVLSTLVVVAVGMLLL